MRENKRIKKNMDEVSHLCYQVFKYLGVLIFICCVSCEKNEKISYINYSKVINDAERYILNKKYDSALKSYKAAIYSIDKPLLENCFTALQVSAFLKDTKSFKRISKKAFKRGLSTELILRDSLLNKFVKGNKLNPYLQKEYKKHNKDYENSIDHELKDSLFKLVDLDQKWKYYYLDSLSKIDPNNSNQYLRLYDSIISDIVENNLIPLIKERGYPGERKIGHGLNKNGDYNYSFKQVTARNIFWHYYILQKPCSNYNDLFYAEMLKGNMSPRDYASILDFQSRHGSDTLCANVQIYNEHYIINDSTKFSAYNLHRELIGLETIEERALKYLRGQEICKKIKENNFEQIKLFYWCG